MKADAEAKCAAAGDSSNKAKILKYLHKPLKTSVSALKQKHNKIANEAWKAEWQTSERYKRLRALDIISPDSKEFITLTSDHRITRQMASLIFQLRVGHSPLNEYLHYFRLVDKARCPACGEASETAEHFILRCPKYAHERWILLQHLRDHTLKLENVLSDPKTIIPILQYISETNRLAGY